ncbi:ABC transporter ATP-binding protein [Intestinibacter sp.]|uniref:ABC transporter ATP-binding protein n=1 Tax=Intestinibacter sp. TaxID=1965304 RepID=UPI003F158F8E
MLFRKGIDIMEKVLKVENLCKNQILNNISFSMKLGEMVAIMGPSGSGKSTLLYNIAGMDRPSSGKVWLKEKEITALSEDEKSNLRLHKMGFVFQQMNMMSNLNIMDNILLPAVQANKVNKKKKSKAELEDSARELMKKLSVSDLQERSITQVSGGQLQRACICRSIINHPEILFADEPTGALNKSAAGEVMNELLKLNREGMTILMVTHDSKVASKCSRILYLVDGSICGELFLDRLEIGTEKQREEKVNTWLMEMGW